MCELKTVAFKIAIRSLRESEMKRKGLCLIIVLVQSCGLLKHSKIKKVQSSSSPFELLV